MVRIILRHERRKMDLNKPDYYRKYYLEKAKEFIDRWIGIHQ